jgi:class 3 adenylate cyclase
MFCDLAGSAALSGGLDTEELHDVLAAYRSVCAEVVGQFSTRRRRMGFETLEREATALRDLRREPR